MALFLKIKTDHTSPKTLLGCKRNAFFRDMHVATVDVRQNICLSQYISGVSDIIYLPKSQRPQDNHAVQM